MTAALLVLTPLLPIAIALCALVPGLRAHVGRLALAAPVPGLLAALFAERGVTAELPGALLGVGLALDGIGGVFLGFAAFLWLAAGLFARAYMGAATPAFWGFWCATLAGSLGVFVALDAITFYVAFAFVSLSAYGLVVHEGTFKALRAGRVYIVLAVFGETCLLLGFMLGAAAADGIGIAEIRGALPDAPQRDLALALLLAGFGLKAGLVPLHVWLPLAHPAAPTPASAVLSGAIVKAGVFGLMRFLPLEAALPVWADILVVGGLATAYYGVVVGLGQPNPKTILAYSTLSQMGLVIAVLGAGLGSPQVGLTLAVATLYAAHHGLAKGALFLSVAVIGKSGARALPWAMAATGLMAIAIAGLPLTGGALAKLAIKGPVGEGTAALLVTLSAIGTTLLMLRFLAAVRATAADDLAARPPPGLLAPWLAVVVAALAVPWLLFPGLAERPAAYALGLDAIWGGLWPILAALVIAALAFRRLRHDHPYLPEGD
ncbi:MAG TPA: proton-conducting transporter membrane subunit, partial [Beijerinckiaceae bacterium]|nr:proton-conducting transporter membrane subunit [Beijerinckiaceae bacterium]